MKKVAIVGASGFVGTRLVEYLVLNRIAEVVPVVRSFSSLAVLSRFELPWKVCDVQDTNALAAAFAGAGAAALDQYDAMGRALGTAVQLTSDCRDLFEAPHSKDLAAGTRTLPIALTLDRLAGNERTEFVALLHRARTDTAAGMAVRERIRAYAAATDNVGLFFGEDIFIAIGSILLIRGFLEQNGILVEPVRLALWAIPTAVAAFLVHGARLLLLDRRLAAQVEAGREEDR